MPDALYLALRQEVMRQRLGGRDATMTGWCLERLLPELRRLPAANVLGLGELDEDPTPLRDSG